MKSKLVIVWLILAFIFAISAIFMGERTKVGDLPFSSYNDSAEGTMVAYLLLDELGFNVKRKTVSLDKWNEEGFIIALGPEYLPESGQDLVIENGRFSNLRIRQNAKEFVEMMFPYKDTVIVFDEYARSMLPLKTNETEKQKPASVWDIMPIHLRFIFLNCLALVIFSMFFYEQRLGEAKIPESFSVRSVAEGVAAMAAAMLKARVFKECVEFYYQYQTRKNSDWDIWGNIGGSIKSLETERQALKLMAEIDQKRNEKR